MPAGDVEDRWTLRAANRALLGNKTGATRQGPAPLGLSPGDRFAMALVHFDHLKGW